MPGGKKTWFTADCEKHGIRDYKKGIQAEVKRVIVGTPLTKKERFCRGCPVCMAEKKSEIKLNKRIV